MKLSDQDKRMLDGEKGKAFQEAMAHLVAFGKAIEAEEMVDIDSCHLLIDWMLTFEAGLEMYEKYANMGAKFKVHTTVEPIAFDYTRWDEFNLPGEFYEKQKLINLAVKKMGGILTCSCQIHFHHNQPKFGDNLAWTEGNASGYANSVVGARGNRESTISSLFAAITGRLPKYGLLCEENRRAQLIIEIDTEVVEALQSRGPGTTSSEYSLLGMTIGDIAFDKIPAIVGLPKMTNEELKGLFSMTSPALTTSLAHIVGLTPEALTLEAAFGGKIPKGIERKRVTHQMLDVEKESLSQAPTNAIDAILTGCPFKHIYELQELADLLEGIKIKEGIDFAIFTDRSIMAQAEANGIRARIERSGARVYQDACPVMFPHRLINGPDKVFATDSVKMIRLIRGAGKPSWYFGSLIDLIKAAQTGQFVRTI